MKDIRILHLHSGKSSFLCPGSLYEGMSPNQPKPEKNIKKNISQYRNKRVGEYFKTHGFQLFNHLHAITFHLSVNFAKFRKNLTRSWLQLPHANRGKDVPKLYIDIV